MESRENQIAGSAYHKVEAGYSREIGSAKAESSTMLYSIIICRSILHYGPATAAYSASFLAELFVIGPLATRNFATRAIHDETLPRGVRDGS